MPSESAQSSHVPVKERTTAAWCINCNRRPTWSARGICYRCSHDLDEDRAILFPSRRRDALEGFAPSPLLPPLALFLLDKVEQLTIRQ